MVGRQLRHCALLHHGFVLGLKAFTAAVLGGIGNLGGAMAGGLLLGVIEASARATLAIDVSRRIWGSGQQLPGRVRLLRIDRRAGLPAVGPDGRAGGGASVRAPDTGRANSGGLGRIPREWVGWRPSPSRLRCFRSWPCLGTAWVRIIDFALLYVMLALGLNIVVGFAGLLDLGYIAFYAVGAYTYALLASPHFGIHLPVWVVLPIGRRDRRRLRGASGRADAEAARRLPGHRHAGLRRDHADFPQQPRRAGQYHQRPQGIRIDPIDLRRLRRGRTPRCSASTSVGAPTTTSCSCCARRRVDLVSLRLQNSRIGRAWVAIREDEIAAKAMGINTRNVKLLAFAMGASVRRRCGRPVRRVSGLRQSGEFQS